MTVTCSFSVSIGNLATEDSFHDADTEDFPSLLVFLRIEEVEKTLLYDSISLDEFDSTESIIDWIHDTVQQDAIILGAVLEFEEKEIIRMANSYFYEDDLFD